MEISRRRALQIALGAGAAAVAIPGAQYAMWRSQEFERDGFSNTLPTPPQGGQVWSNWSGIETSMPKLITAPKSEDQLATLLKNTSGTIRPVGSGHSFTRLVPSEGTIVDVGKFAGLLDHDSETRTATLGAGTRLRHSARLLGDVGLGFHNLPDIDVQTLAGSFSTATHGTGKTLHAIHNHAIGMRLVTPQGEILDLSKSANPDLFDAAKVSLGALGVITQYTLQLRDNYALQRRMWVDPSHEVLARAEERFDTHRNYELFYVPNAPLAADLAHDEYDGEISGLEEEADSNEMLDALEMFRDHLGWWPWLRSKVVQAAFPRGEVDDVSDDYWKLLATTRTLKFNEMEYHIPAENGFAALKEIIAILEKDEANYFPIECRMTGQDNAWLSPFNDGERISIAVHAAHSENYQYFFDTLEPVFRKHGGRPHWGKLHSLENDALSALYPRLKDFNEIRRQLDPQGKLLNPYLARLMGETSNG